MAKQIVLSTAKRGLMDTASTVPVSETVVEVEFEVTKPSVPCVAATTELGGRFELEEIIPRGDGRYAEFYSVEDLDPDRLMEFAATHQHSKAQFLSRHEDGGLLELVVDADCPALCLAELGAFPRYVSCTEGVCRLLGEVTPQYDAGDIIPCFLDEYPDAELVAKREKSYFTPLFTHRELDKAVRDHLTDRQREVLHLAHERGYYEWPRGATQEELADELDISVATFTQHLRTAEQKLITMVFEEGSVKANAVTADYQV